jgi:hypothetical protein
MDFSGYNMGGQPHQPYEMQPEGLPDVQVASFPDVGNVINDPTFMGYLKTADRLGSSEFTLHDDSGETMKFRSIFPDSPDWEKTRQEIEMDQVWAAIEIMRELPVGWPNIQVDSLPDTNGNTLTDPATLGFLDAAKQLGTSGFTMHDPNGEQLEFQIEFPQLPDDFL